MGTKVIVLYIAASFLFNRTISSRWLNLEYGDSNLREVIKGDATFNITGVRWAVLGEVFITVCSNDSLDDEKKNVTTITLSYGPTFVVSPSEDVTYGPTFVVSPSEDDISGVLDKTGKCAVFSGLPNDFRLPASSTIYILKVLFEDGSSKAGAVTFAMTVTTTLLECPGSFFTKVSWKDESTTLINPNCTEAPMPLDLICYHIGDLTNREFCFTVTNEVAPYETIAVCLDGPTDRTAFLINDGDFSVNSLQYGDGSSHSPSITLGPAWMTTHAVMVRTGDGRSTVHRCYDNACPLPDQFMPSTNRYQVCGDLDTVQTATTTFYDLQVTIFETAVLSRAMVARPYLQFVFANALSNKTYAACLLQDLPPGEDDPIASVMIDCTQVAVGHACFGALFIEIQEGEVFLAVSNADDGTNQVIVPYNASSATIHRKSTL